MKKLVLGALVAVAASTGCTAEVTVEPDPDPIFASLVTVRWDFQSTAGAARSCPVGYPVARVVSQATDPNTYLPTGTTYVDDYRCSDGQGTLELPDEDTYIVWVEILSNSGALYARSQENFVDTLLDGDPGFDVQILDDGGYFTLTWDLVDAGNSAPLSCQSAAATDVHVVTTLAGPDKLTDDVFDCADHFGTTDGLRAGDYTISINAERNDGGPLGPVVTFTDEITAPNGLTFLGQVDLPID